MLDPANVPCRVFTNGRPQNSKGFLPVSSHEATYILLATGVLAVVLATLGSQLKNQAVSTIAVFLFCIGIVLFMIYMLHESQIYIEVSIYADRVVFTRGNELPCSFAWEDIQYMDFTKDDTDSLSVRYDHEGKSKYFSLVENWPGFSHACDYALAMVRAKPEERASILQMESPPPRGQRTNYVRGVRPVDD